MAKIYRQIEERRQKIHIRTYATLCTILFLIMGFYTYNKFQEYSYIKSGLQASTNIAGQLRTEVAQVKTHYDNNKKDFDQLDKIMDQNLATVFPSNDNYTELTRALDSYEEDLAQNNSPFEVSNIEYQNPTTSEEEAFSVLPFRMTIRSSSDNFTKFLHLVENSGAFDGDARLMDMSSIKLNFENSEGDQSEELINFTVQINAYFQK